MELATKIADIMGGNPPMFLEYVEKHKNTLTLNQMISELLN